MKKFISFIFALLIWQHSFGQKAQLKVQAGHMSFVSGIDFTTDGRHLLSAALDGHIKVWESSTGREIKDIATGLPIQSMRLTADGKTVVLMDMMGQIGFWDLNSLAKQDASVIKFVQPNFLGIVPTTQPYQPIAVAKKTNLLAVANEGDAVANYLKLDKLKGVISVFEIPTGKKKSTFRQNDAVITAISFADAETIVTSDVNNNIKIWDLTKGKAIATIASGQTGIYALAANEKYIVTGGKSGSLKIWDLKSSKITYDLKGHNGDLTAISIGENWLASNDKYSMKIWDLSTGSMLFDNGVENISGQYANIYNTCQIQDGMVASSWFGAINLYDIQSTRKMQTFMGNDNGLIGATFIPGTTRPGMIYQGADQLVTKIWDYPNVKSSTIQINVSGQAVIPHPGMESVMVFKPTADQTISIYDIESSALKSKLTGHLGPVHKASYSPDGALIATGSSDNTIRIWDAQTGQEIKQLTRRGFASVGFRGELFISNNNKKVLSLGVDQDPTQVWDLETGRFTNIDCGKFIGTAKAISPDGTMIAGLEGIMEKKTSIPAITVYNTKTGARTHTFTTSVGPFIHFSADNQWLCITTAKGVEVMDLATNESKYTLDHQAVNHYAFSADNTRLLTAGADGLTKLWNTETGQEIAAFVSYRDNENTIVLPNKYYYSTKGAVNGIHYILDNKAIPFDQFDLQYNRPDLVFKALGVEDQSLLDSYYNAYQKRLSKSGLDEASFVGEYHMPKIQITSKMPIKTDEKMVQLSVSASDIKYNLQRLIISVNNVPIHGQKGIELTTGNIYDQSYDIELTNGRNKIGVLAINEKGVKSIEETVEIQYTGPEARPNLHLMVIGVSNYADNKMNLTYAAKDAEDVAALFESQSDKYGTVNVYKLINEEATMENIISVGKGLKNTKVDDEVVIFMAGHGLLDQQLDYYFGTPDINFNNPNIRGLKYETVTNFLDGIPARKKLLMIDACHSGEVDKEDINSTVSSKPIAKGKVNFRGFDSSQRKSVGLQSSFRLMQELYSDLRRGTGAIVISSAGGAEFAFESPEWSNGVFTFALLEGIQTGKCDQDKNGSFSVSEIRDYVIGTVINLTDGQQHPTSRSENLEFDFNIW